MLYKKNRSPKVFLGQHSQTFVLPKPNMDDNTIPLAKLNAVLNDWYSTKVEKQANPKLIPRAVIQKIQRNWHHNRVRGPLSRWHSEANSDMIAADDLLTQPVLPQGYTNETLLTFLSNAGLADEFKLQPPQLLSVYSLLVQRHRYLEWKFDLKSTAAHQNAVLFANPGAGKTLMATAYALAAFCPTFQGNFPLTYPVTTLPEGHYFPLAIRGSLYLLDSNGGIRAAPDVRTSPDVIPAPKRKRRRCMLVDDTPHVNMHPVLPFPPSIGLSYDPTSDCILPVEFQNILFLNAVEESGIIRERSNDCKIAAKTLIVCPTSVAPNWIAKLKKYRPDANVVSHLSGGDTNITLARNISMFAQADYVVTTPNLAMGSTSFNPFLCSPSVYLRDVPALVGEPGDEVSRAVLNVGNMIICRDEGGTTSSSIVVQTQPTLVLLGNRGVISVPPPTSHFILPTYGSSVATQFDHNTFLSTQSRHIGERGGIRSNSPFQLFHWASVIVDEAHRLTKTFREFMTTKMQYKLRLDLTANQLKPTELKTYFTATVMPMTYAFTGDVASMTDVPEPTYTWASVPLSDFAAGQVRQLVASGGQAGFILRQLRTMLTARRVIENDTIFSTNMSVRMMPAPVAVVLDDITSKFGSVGSKASGALNMDEQCAVCYEEFEAPVMLTCHHVFCCQCIMDWIQERRTTFSTATRVACPTCRSECTIVSIKFIEMDAVEKAEIVDLTLTEETKVEEEEPMISSIAPSSPLAPFAPSSPLSPHSTPSISVPLPTATTTTAVAPTTGTDPTRHLWNKITTAHQWIQARLTEGRKTVVVSAFESTLRALSGHLSGAGLPVTMVSGSVGAKRRAVHLSKFEVDTEPSVLLISARAAGMGLDLPFAKAMLLMEPLNAAMHIQGVGRVLRTGQTSVVPIHILAWSETPEEDMARFVCDGSVITGSRSQDSIRDAGLRSVRRMMLQRDAETTLSELASDLLDEESATPRFRLGAL